jgi:hypothetical protein
MADMYGAPRRCRKARRNTHDHHGQWKKLASPKQEGGYAQRYGRDDGNGKYWLAVGRKVEGNAGSESHGDPWQQPSGAGFRAHPFAKLIERTRPDAKPGCKTARLRAAARWPSLRDALYPARRPAPLSHPAPPYATSLACDAT